MTDIAAVQDAGAKGADKVAVASPPRRPAPKKPQQPEPRLDALHNVRLSVQVVLGEVSVPLRELLGFEVGQVVGLDRPAGSPAEVIVNGRLMFRGEIVVVDDEYAVRVTEVVSPEQLV